MNIGLVIALAIVYIALLSYLFVNKFGIEEDDRNNGN